MHPLGHEVVLCTAGVMTLHQELPDGTQQSATIGARDTTTTTTTTTVPPTTTTTTTTTVPPTTTPTQGDCPSGYYQLTDPLPTAWIDLFNSEVSFDQAKGLHPEPVVWVKQRSTPRTQDRGCYKARFTVTDSGPIGETELRNAAEAALEVGSTAYNAICSIELVATSEPAQRRAAKTKTVRKIATMLGTTSAQITQRAVIVLNVVCLPATVQTVLGFLQWFGGIIGTPKPVKAPSGLELARTTNTITLNWTRPNIPEGFAPVKAYSVVWAGSTWSNQDRTWNANRRLGGFKLNLDEATTTYTLTGLVQGTRYQVTLCAHPFSYTLFRLEHLLGLAAPPCVTSTAITSDIINPPPTTTTTTTTTLPPLPTFTTTTTTTVPP